MANSQEHPQTAPWHALIYVIVLWCPTPQASDAPHVGDPDVVAEEARVRQNPVGQDTVEARGLRKVFRTKDKDGHSCVKAAVKDMWFGIKRGEVFGFLGTNGAGKSTVFKMLSGDHLPSVGSAAMCGQLERPFLKCFGCYVATPQASSTLSNWLPWPTPRRPRHPH